MADATPRQESFQAGELAPAMHGNFSNEAFRRGVALARNWIINKYGSMLNRPGTILASATKTAGKKSRIFPFDFSDGQAYALEVGEGYVRVRDIGGNLLTLQVTVATALGDTDYRSEDGGSTWDPNLVTGLPAGTWYGVYNNGSLWVAVGANICATSPDGKAWTSRTMATGAWKAVTWNGTRWVAVGDAGKFTTSTDGITWAAAGTINASYGLTGVTANGLAMVAVSPGHSFTSSDGGLTWGTVNTVAAGATNWRSSVVWTGAEWVTAIIIGDYSGRNVVVYTSANGTAWTKAAQGTAYSAQYLAVFGSGTHVVVACQGDLLTTDDSNTWVNRGSITAISGPNAGVLGTDGSGIMVGDTEVATTSDFGKSWAPQKATGDVALTGTLLAVAQTSTTATEIALPYLETDLPRLQAKQEGDVITFTCRGYSPRTLTRYGGTLSNPAFRTAKFFPAVPGTLVTGVTITADEVGDPTNYPLKEWQWVVSWQADAGRESLPSAPFSTTSGKAALYLNKPATVSIPKVTGATVYHVYRGRNGLYGYVGSLKSTGAATETFHDDGSTPVLSSDPYQWSNPLDADVPACTAFFEGRQAWANLAAGPAKIRFSATDDYVDYDESVVQKDDDSFTLGIRTQRYEEIRWMAQLDGLLVGTSEAEWLLGGAQGAPMSYRSKSADPLTYNGSSWVQPILMNREVLYVQARGSEVRNLFRSAAGWESIHVSLLADHLFDGKSVVAWAYARRPYSIIWLVFSDGTMAACTYDRQLGVQAWVRGDTYGGVDHFEDVCVINENGLDVPWFTVLRNGVRYVERLAKRAALGKSDDFCGLDSAVHYTGIQTNTVTGLSHLNGRQVYGLGDGKVYGPVTVVGGAAVFPASASQWWAGLQITCQGYSLDYPEARTQQKSIARVFVEITPDATLDPNAGISVGQDLDHLSEVVFGNIQGNRLEQIVSSSQNPGARVAWQLTDPVPVEIQGITREVEVGY